MTYIKMQLEAERNAKAEVVISDRSLLDLLAYVRTNADSRIPSSFVSTLEEIVHLESLYFDLYCYVPIEFGLIVDEVRPADESYQRAIDETFRRLLGEFQLPHKEIRGTLPERMAQIVDWLAL